LASYPYLTEMTTFHGASRRIENTHLNLLIPFNLLALLQTTTGHRFGTQNRRIDASSFAGLFYRIKHGRADRIIKFGGQANPICQLYRAHQESAIHLLAQCPFSLSIWKSLGNWIGVDLQPLPQHSYRKLRTWWSSMLINGRSEQGEVKLLGCRK
jgi:hypothetical protein